MTRHVLTLSLLLILVPGLTAQVSVKELSRKIAKEGDGVDPSIFEQLGKIGSKEAHKALRNAVVLVKDDDLLKAIYEAFTHFRGRGDLESATVEFLRTRGFRAKKDGESQEAIRVLRTFGPVALESLERLVTSHKDARCRALACDPIVPVLAHRGDRKSLRTILENASLTDESIEYIEAEGASAPTKPHRVVLRDLIVTLRGPENRSLLIDYLHDTSLHRAWRELLIEVLAQRKGRDIPPAIGKVLEDSDPALVHCAVDALVAREDWELLGTKLRPLLKSPDGTIRRKAVVAITTVELGNLEWHEELIELSSSKDSATRMGVAQSLAEIRTPEAIKALYPMLGDKEWAVRVETVQAVGKLRRKDSIPVLIERLDGEEHRVREEVYDILRWITAKDLGIFADSWRQWWTNEGDSFQIPNVEVARAEESRRKNRKDRGTRAISSFYGLPVQSKRTIFVLDTSGSMRLEAKGLVDFEESGGTREAVRRRAGASGKTRMEVAKEQLSLAIRNLAEDTLYNIIFFETEVRSQSDKLVKMRRATRQKSLRYIRDQFPMGATAMYPALKKAFEDPLVDTMYVLTDGAPTIGDITDIKEIRAEIGRWNSARHVKIHGIAMGQHSDLLRWLAEDTGGRYVRVE